MIVLSGSKALGQHLALPGASRSGDERLWEPGQIATSGGTAADIMRTVLRARHLATFKDEAVRAVRGV